MLAKYVVSARNTKPKIVINIPSHSAVFGLISPVTVGLFFVLSIIESISRSYKLLNAPSAPIIKIEPIKANRISGIFSNGLILYLYKASVNPANIGTKLDLIIPVLIV